MNPRSPLHVLIGVVALLSLANATPAQACDENVRKSYLADVNAGAPADYLESKYGFCRQSTAPTSEGPSTMAFMMTNWNTTYERLTSCGYQPRAMMSACPVNIRLNVGYGPFGAPPAGSWENVRFCYDCNNTGVWTYTTLGTLHVTDNAFPGTWGPDWFQLVHTMNTNPAYPFPCNTVDGRTMRVRAILSWAFVPPANCGGTAWGTSPGIIPGLIWGNMIDYTVRRDP